MKNRTLKKVFSRFSLVAMTIILLFLAFVAGLGALIYLLYVLIANYLPAVRPYVVFLLYFLSWLIVFIAVLHAANRDMVPETKVPWILCIVALNVLGVAIYVTFSSHRPSRRTHRVYSKLLEETSIYEQRVYSAEELREALGAKADVSEALFAVNRSAIVRSGTKTEYFPSGEAMLPRLLEDLKGAQKYIFMEYFILEAGKCWDAILEVLEAKVREGVEVRLLYDDIGCMGKVRVNYDRLLREKGIQCNKFNPFVPIVTNVHNNRDHRKITVIDGRIGYTGGINLADEYINETHPFGYWKDTAVRLEGVGVRNMLLTFMRLYCVQKRRAEDVTPYIPAAYENFCGEGFVQPYGDGPYPLYGRHLSEDVFINMIANAHRYAWITTPYLIIDYRMREALILAAKRGVDVRIVTPHIPDKKIPFAITRSNYMTLIRGGVKIYEYTPGFIHAKQILVDDELAVIGTVNLDYRSFLYHFENAVLMFHTHAIEEMKADMVGVFEVSKQQTEEDAKRNVVWRGICEIAKIFAPLF